jgi:drug/metabolite transporter (DMT)-like permease
MKMATPLQIVLIVFSGMAIAGGQGCITVYARGLSSSFHMAQAILYSLTAWSFYGFVILYGSGTVAMVFLLRSLPLAQVSISILAITFLCTTALTFWFGDHLSIQQLVGIALVLVGVTLIQS